MIWVLLTAALALIVTGLICNTVLWKMDSTIGLVNQRKLLEEWQIKRKEIIESSYPTLSFKLINPSSNQFGIPVLPKKFNSLASLRVPLFKVGDKENLLFNWIAFQQTKPAVCSRSIENVCSTIFFKNGRSLVFSDLHLENLEIGAGQWILAVTGEVRIDRLKVSAGGKLEIISGLDLKLGEVSGDENSELFLGSVHGQIDFPALNRIECKNSPNIRLNSQGLTKPGSTRKFPRGCLEVKPSIFWQDLRYIGEIPLKLISP
jgi:hypothetical protein